MKRLLLLLAACSAVACNSGSSDDHENSVRPPPAPMSATPVPMEWTLHPALGGMIHDLAYREHELFVIADDAAFRFDGIESAWSIADIDGSAFTTTADGYIYTNAGYRLTPGEHEWQKLAASGTLWLGEDGRTLYRPGENDGLLVSHDNAQTWNALPALPGGFRDIQEFNGELHAVVYETEQRLWRLADTAWQPLADLEGLRELAVTPDGVLVALGRDAMLSTNGTDWTAVSGETFRFPSEINHVGTDGEGNPLFDYLGTLFRIDDTRAFRPVVTARNPAYVQRIAVPDTSHYLVGAMNGLWEVTTSDGQTGERLIGVPGDRIARLFHLASGTYASKNTGPGMSTWARFEPSGNAWIPQTLTENSVRDVVVLPNGDQLLATVYSLEAGYGALFRWSVDDGDIERLYTGPEIVAVAVDNQGRWLLAEGAGIPAEGEDSGANDYRVLVSIDQGTTWEDSGLDASGEHELVSYCDAVFAVGADGVHLMTTEAAGWKQLSQFPGAISGTATREKALALHTRDRLWWKTDCDDNFLEVALPAGTQLHDVALDATGGIWATTGDGGIHLAPGENSWRRFGAELPEGERRHLSIDDNGTVWIRVAGSGIWSGFRESQP